GPPAAPGGGHPGRLLARGRRRAARRPARAGPRPLPPAAARRPARRHPAPARSRLGGGPVRQRGALGHRPAASPRVVRAHAAARAGRASAPPGQRVAVGTGGAAARDGASVAGRTGPARAAVAARTRAGRRAAPGRARHRPGRAPLATGRGRHPPARRRGRLGRGGLRPLRGSRLAAGLRPARRRPHPPLDDARGVAVTSDRITPDPTSPDRPAPGPGTEATALLRPHAEQAYADELRALAAVDDRPRPPSWRLSPWAVVTYLLGGALADGTVVTPKYVGPRRLMEVAVATLATDRALLLLGVPGTAKTWVSEHLAAAISGDSTLLVQGTSGT